MSICNSVVRGFIGLSALCLVNCIVTAKSIKDPNYTESPKRIFVFLQGQQGAENFIINVGKNVCENLKKYNIASDYYVPEVLSLSSETDTKNNISSFHPDLIMEISQTQYSTYNGAKSGAKLLVTLSPPGYSNPVWKAEINSSTGGYGGMGIPSQIASTIISKLIEDGILKSTSTANQTGNQ